MDRLRKPNFNIAAVDMSRQDEIQRKIDNLNKPRGSLGRLEDLARQLCLIQQTDCPRLQHPCHLLFGGDHGIEREGVSVSPREVTWQQMVNFTRGGGGVNMFCRQHGFSLRVVDVGVDHDLSTVAAIDQRKIRRGTRNFLHEAAMTNAELWQAIDVGASLVDQCAAEGCTVVSIGEMGIGNTSPSAVWMSFLTGTPLADCIGRGAGLDDHQLAHKHDVLTAATARFAATGLTADATTLMGYFGGYEMVAAVGAMLRAAERRMVVLVDGFIMTACALAATALYGAAKDYMVFAHCGDEQGHRTMLNAMGAQPLLALGLRLGEGTGALCAYPIVESAARMMTEMGNFADNHITKYF